MSCYLRILPLFCVISCVARDEGEYSSQGNLALPTSQQPSPLFCLGQNIVNKNDLQAFLYPTSAGGHNRQMGEVTPALLYGIRDNLSLYVTLPIAVELRVGPYRSKGIEDLTFQLEWAYYSKYQETGAAQATLVANMSLPTGDAYKLPPTGGNNPSFFIGGTFSYVGVDWYPFVSGGATLYTPDKNSQHGNKFYYQWGLCKNISYRPKECILSLFLEFYGLYAQRHRIRGQIIPNLGGNVIFCGPNLWFSTERLIAQAGIMFPIYQRLFGIQPKYRYYAAVDLGWKFNS